MILGLVTSFHQFGRSLGGTIGVGICGGLVTNGLFDHLVEVSVLLPDDMIIQLQKSAENLLRPEFQSQVPAGAVEALRYSVLNGVSSVFLVATISSLGCLFCCLGLSKKEHEQK